jgi:hypothetical protein
MKLRDLDLNRILKKIDEDVKDWDLMWALDEAYELWTWHPGMG